MFTMQQALQYHWGLNIPSPGTKIPMQETDWWANNYRKAWELYTKQDPEEAF